MGVPQVSSSGIAEEVVTALSAFVQHPPQLLGVSSCGLTGKHGGNMGNQMQVDLPQSKFGALQRKTTEEHLRDTGTLNMHEDVRPNIHRMKIGIKEKNCWHTIKNGQNIQAPVPRIMSFETRNCMHSLADIFNGKQTSSTVVSIRGSTTQTNRLPIRKRLLSPLNGMLHYNQFDSDAVDIGRYIYQSDFEGENDKCSISSSKEHKKAHIGSSNVLTPPVWSMFCFPEWNKSPEDNNPANSILFTDGPRLENKMVQPHSHFPFSPGFNHSAKRTNERHQTQAMVISAKKAISPPLSLLGPNFTEGIKSVGECKETANELDDVHVTFKDMENPLKVTHQGQKDKDFQFSRTSMHNFENLKKKIDICRPEFTS
ncbi:hypothetical protein SLA2020_141120 [Shorea laevis]